MRSFNPYSSAPPPPSSVPDFSIDPLSIISLTNEEAGVFIESFLQTQNGKVLALHRLANHLLGRAPTIDGSDIKELEDVIEEERRRDEGALLAQPDEVVGVEEAPALVEILDAIPEIKPDKKRARKEERRLKKEKEREKRKREPGPETSENILLQNKKTKKDQRP
jgi:hypothetical protein